MIFVSAVKLVPYKMQYLLKESLQIFLTIFRDMETVLFTAETTLQSKEMHGSTDSLLSALCADDSAPRMLLQTSFAVAR